MKRFEKSCVKALCGLGRKFKLHKRLISQKIWTKWDDWQQRLTDIMRNKVI